MLLDLWPILEEPAASTAAPNTGSPGLRLSGPPLKPLPVHRFDAVFPQTYGVREWVAVDATCTHNVRTVVRSTRSCRHGVRTIQPFAFALAHGIRTPVWTDRVATHGVRVPVSHDANVTSGAAPRFTAEALNAYGVRESVVALASLSHDIEDAAEHELLLMELL